MTPLVALVQLQTAALLLSRASELHPMPRKRPCRCCRERKEYDIAVAQLVAAMARRLR